MIKIGSPIIYYHEGYASFVPIILKHNIQYISNNNQYIISDYKYNNIEYINIYKYDNSDNLKTFKKYYQTLCNNNASYDYVCYKRWYVIYSFMIRNNLNSVWYLDSDVLLFKDLSEIEEKFKGFDAALILSGEKANYSSIFDYYQSYIDQSDDLPPLSIVSGHTSYFTIRGLKNLLDLGLHMFRDSFEICSSFYQKAFVNTGKNGGVDDMHLITNYYLNNKDKIYDLSESRYYFDLQASITRDKKNVYQSTKIHGIELKRLYNNKIIRNGISVDVATLHFQHLSKYCIHKYLNYRLAHTIFLQQVSILYFRRIKSFLSRLKKSVFNV